MSRNDFEVITLKRPGVTDFARARNELLKKAKSNWAFFLDSDEKLSDRLRKEIFSRVQDNKFNGYYVRRRNYFLGNYVGTDRIVRLGRVGAGKWVRPIHEVWNIKGPIGELKNPLVHNTAGSVSHMIEKINSYSTLHAKANISEGKSSNLFKIIFFPKLKFLQSLLIGRGVVFSILQAFHSYLSWSKQWLLQNG